MTEAMVVQENGHIWMPLKEIAKQTSEYCVGRNMVSRDAILYHILEKQGLDVVKHNRAGNQYKGVRASITTSMDMMDEFERSGTVWARKVKP